MAPVLRIRDLCVEYRTPEGTVAAVRHFSLDLAAGETTALVGESGAGRTSVGLSVLGLVPHPGAITGGAIRLRDRDERDLVGASGQDLRAVRGSAVSMIFQDPVAGLNPVIEVGAQIEETIASHRDLSKKEARAAALEALATMRLPDPKRIARAYPGELSGGMCQRVMIAIATVLDPAVLIADEPTSALDVTVQAQILDELDRLRQERGTAILLITHDLGVVAQIADRTAVLYAGALLEEGETRAIFRAPRHPYTWSLLDTLPRLDRARGRTLPQIRGAPPDLRTLDGHCSFLPRCPKALTTCRQEPEPPMKAVGEAGQRVACYNPVEAPAG